MKELNELLEYIEAKVDPDLRSEIDHRYQRALSFQPGDQPPLVLQCQENPLGLKTFPYREAFDNPAKMMFNQLLTRVVPGLEFKDDSPLAIRTDHGTIIIATLFGCEFSVEEDMYPWVKPIEDVRDLEKLAARGLPELNGGIGPKVAEFLQYYREKLSHYPKCRKTLQIAVPDLQGPFDTAHEIWGSEIFVYFYERPDLIEKLLDLVAKTMVAFYRRIKPLTVDRLSPRCICQHGYMIPGEILIRDDSIINISAQMYAEHIRPRDEYVLSELGGGSIHFCGNSQHQIDSLLEIQSLKGLDFGEPLRMDIDAIYRKCADRRIPVTNMMVSPDDVVSGQAMKRFPAGVVFTCQVKTIAEGQQVIREYRKQGEKV